MSAETAADGVRTAITDKLPAGSQLAQLALRMLEHTQSWLLMVNKHLDAELTKLTQMHISADEALILLSEEIIIMFNQFYAIRRKRMEFRVKGTWVEYTVQCICLTLQVHMAMDYFTRDWMNYNPAISAACVLFLTKQMGGNVSSGVGGQMQMVNDKIKTIEALAKEAKKESSNAIAHATMASSAVDDVKKKLNSLQANNPTLKK